MSLLTGARDSPLSIAQFKEFQALVAPIKLIPVFIKTTGDVDKRTSLRTLEKTDFFTKELDEMLLREEIRLAVHSAKDLPDPIRAGLKVVGMTQGIDSRDALVLRGPLAKGMLIATSSHRREQAVSSLWDDLNFCDVRGTIGERLALLEQGKIDGLVVAEAALIRLKLTHLNRIYLPGETTPHQGRLAIVGRADDLELEGLFEHSLARS